MVDYDGFRRIIQGSHSYEFDDTKITLTGFYSGEEAVLDFENMNESMFDELVEESTDNIGYKQAKRILAGSKRYEFEDTVLSVTDYFTGDEVRLDLGRVDEDMYEELKAEEMEDDFDDDFEDAVNALDNEEGQSL